MSKPPAVALGKVKALLRRFSVERQSWAPEAAAQELGELVLCLMQQADRLGVDLVTAGEAQLQRAMASARAADPAVAPRPLSLLRTCAAPPERP